MPSTRRLVLLLVALIGFWVIVAYHFLRSGEEDPTYNAEVDELLAKIHDLERQLDIENVAIKRLQAEVEANSKLIRANRVNLEGQEPHGPWKEPIPILVFSCNRKDAVRAHVDRLISLRPSAERFPIIVSQDCDDEATAQAIKSFGDKVTYVKHIAGDKANLTIPNEHKRWTTYYRIARHYKLALHHTFRNLGYSTVVITEDDLDVAPDFFEYFSATRYLLDADPTLYCVSAWNDNGKKHLINENAPELLYRSDFFPGLGWMMSKKLWDEFEPRWPQGFWDDWIREPENRKNRSCIRPEISRTAMSAYGQKGASEGLFFTKHLARVVLNHKSVEFTKLNLDYLQKNNYDSLFIKTVYTQAEPIRIDEMLGVPKSGSVRITYDANLDYIKKADKLQIMHDFKAGVPRTAYQGVVTAFLNGLRVYLVPDPAKVSGYNKKWEVPAGID
ncbi:unnamed protein product, partial [Mesorhabditis spiculigera]